MPHKPWMHLTSLLVKRNEDKQSNNKISYFWDQILDDENHHNIKGIRK